MSLAKNAAKVICYVSLKANYGEIQGIFASDFKNLPNVVHRVERLPRDALVEVEVLAHKDGIHTFGA
jgi:hypothetical protein